MNLLLTIKRALALTIFLSLYQLNFSQTAYASIPGFSSLEDAMPAINFPLEYKTGYTSLEMNHGQLVTLDQKYNDFGLVLKRVKLKFQYEGDLLKMYYFDHEMENKTKGEWETCPKKLTKKDKKFFDDIVAQIKKVQTDQNTQKIAYSEFFSNTMVLLSIMRTSPEKAFEIWKEKAEGVKGKFSYMAFLQANENTDSDFQGYQYKVELEIRQVKEKIPLNIVMYANPKDKDKNPDGMAKDIPGLNKKKDHWFAFLHAEIVSITKKDDGTYLMVLKDITDA